MNPDSGPGTAADSRYLPAITSMDGNGGRTIGYVYTKYGQRPLSQVENDVDAYYAFYPAIDGIFVDEMASQSDTLTFLYYQMLATYIRDQHSGALIVANPGTSFDEDYASKQVADIFIDEESTAEQVNAYAQSGWTQDYPSTTFAEIAIQAADDADEVSTLAPRHIGWMYSTTLAETPNPYATLPADFNDELARVIAVNGSR